MISTMEIHDQERSKYRGAPKSPQSSGGLSVLRHSYKVSIRQT